MFDSFSEGRSVREGNGYHGSTGKTWWSADVPVMEDSLSGPVNLTGSRPQRMDVFLQDARKGHKTPFLSESSFFFHKSNSWEMAEIPSYGAESSAQEIDAGRFQFFKYFSLGAGHKRDCTHKRPGSAMPLFYRVYSSESFFTREEISDGIHELF